MEELMKPGISYFKIKKPDETMDETMPLKAIVCEQHETPAMLSEKETEKNSTLIFTDKDGIHKNPHATIRFVKSDNDYCEIHLSDGTRVVSPELISHIVSELSVSNSFCYCHRSNIVNFDFIDRVDWNTRTIYMKGGGECKFRRNNTNKDKISFEEWYKSKYSGSPNN